MPPLEARVAGGSERPTKLAGAADHLADTLGVVSAAVLSVGDLGLADVVVKVAVRRRVALGARAIGAERDSIAELRLAVVSARRGETLEALGRRTRNAWSPEKTAVANGLEPGVRLSRGQAVKIVIAHPYRP